MRRVVRLLIRRRILVIASLSLMIFSATISVLMGIGAAPGAVIGNPDAYVISSKASSGSLLNSRVDASLSELLLSQGFATNSSPEIFAFAQIGANAIIIRGVEFESFMGVERASLISGAMPTDPSECLIGERLAERIAAKIGDKFPLVGSFDPSVAEATVTGIIRSSSGTSDELLVSLPLARCLSGISSQYVSIIRVLGNVAKLDAIFAPGLPRFSIYNLALSSSVVGVGEKLTVSFSVLNWGDANGSASISVVDESDNSSIFMSNAELTSGYTYQVKFNCSFPTIGNRTLSLRLAGALTQEITANITVKGPYLSIITPLRVAEFHNFTALVVDQTLQPIPGANVTIGGFNFTTNSTGGCLINETLSPGNYTMNATATGLDSASVPVDVVNSASLPSTAQLRTYRITITPGTIKVGQNCSIVLYVQNFGNQSGIGTIKATLNGNSYITKTLTLGPLQTTLLYYNRTFQSAGDYVVVSNSVSAIVTAESKFVLNPTLVQLYLRYGGTGTLDPSRSELIYDTTKISEANILIVLVSLAVLSAVLVTLGVSTGFMKEINDNLKIVGILRSLGASSRQLLWIIFREALIISLPAVLIGIAGGYVLALIIASSGDLLAFGHSISPNLDPSFFAASVTGSVAICVGSSLITGFVVARRSSIKMIRGQKEEAARQPTLKELIGDD